MNRQQIADKRDRFSEIRDQHQKAGRPVSADMVNRSIKALDNHLYKIKRDLEQQLVVGAKIKIGPEYAAQSSFTPGEVIELIEGVFEYDNGLYCENQYAPSIAIDSKYGDDFDSIYHLFGNDLERWMDNKVIFKP